MKNRLAHNNRVSLFFISHSSFFIFLIFLFALQPAAVGQKLIEYESGMGSRDQQNPNVWILYKDVVATHEGMVLFADSAHFDMEHNSLTAFRNIEIQLSDTTTIFGSRLFYDGDERVLNIWGDTVVLIDGQTILKANHLTYDRNQTLAYYDKWGHTVSRNRTLDSKQGYYNSTEKEFYIYEDVSLSDSYIVITTDYLNYNTKSYIAHFETPTHVYSDSSTIYSELGEYNTDTKFAISYRRSHVDGSGWMIDSDTLYYDEVLDYGRGMGNVVYIDSLNFITCTGEFGESNRAENYSYISDSAHVMHVDEYGDTTHIYADTVYMTVDDTAGHLNTLRANDSVIVFRRDMQAHCDSAFYRASDKFLTMYKNPVIWFDHYQCTSDTIELLHDSTGMKLAIFRTNCFTIEQVDRDKYNQLKGRYGQVWFKNGKPDYADVYGNATMVFHITELDDSARLTMVGSNVGRGTDIRIYFDTNRQPRRVVTYDKPEMETYPPGKLPEEWLRLPGFNWQSALRPRKPEDVPGKIFLGFD